MRCGAGNEIRGFDLDWRWTKLSTAPPIQMIGGPTRATPLPLPTMPDSTPPDPEAAAEPAGDQPAPTPTPPSNINTPDSVATGDAGLRAGPSVARSVALRLEGGALIAWLSSALVAGILLGILVPWFLFHPAAGAKGSGTNGIRGTRIRVEKLKIGDFEADGFEADDLDLTLWSSAEQTSMAESPSDRPVVLPTEPERADDPIEGEFAPRPADLENSDQEEIETQQDSPPAAKEPK